MTSTRGRAPVCPPHGTDSHEKRAQYREITPLRWLDFPVTLRLLPGERETFEAAARGELQRIVDKDGRLAECEAIRAREVAARGAGRPA